MCGDFVPPAPEGNVRRGLVCLLVSAPAPPRARIAPVPPVASADKVRECMIQACLGMGWPPSESIRV
jgi:hypothetical protein